MVYTVLLGKCMHAGEIVLGKRLDLTFGFPLSLNVSSRHSNCILFNLLKTLHDSLNLNAIIDYLLD